LVASSKKKRFWAKIGRGCERTPSEVFVFCGLLLNLGPRKRQVFLHWNWVFGFFFWCFFWCLGGGGGGGGGGNQEKQLVGVIFSHPPTPQHPPPPPPPPTPQQPPPQNPPHPPPTHWGVFVVGGLFLLFGWVFLVGHTPHKTVFNTQFYPKGFSNKKKKLPPQGGAKKFKQGKEGVLRVFAVTTRAKLPFTQQTYKQGKDNQNIEQKAKPPPAQPRG